MDSAVLAEPERGCAVVVIVVASVGDVRLWVGGEINYRVRYGVCTPERDDDALWTGCVRKRNVPA